VIGFLRIVGLVNAAVWFGAAVFFTCGIGPAVFSRDMQQLLGANNYPYFSGAIIQVLIARYFDLQLVCGLIAVFHVFVEWLYLSRPLSRFWMGLLAGLVVAGLLGALVFQPRIKALHRAKYAATTAPAQRITATRALRLWHGTSQGVNLLVLVGLGLYLWRTATPSNGTRFLGQSKL
jgi:hypothetical protein